MGPSSKCTVPFAHNIPQAFAALIFLYFALHIVLHHTPPLLGDYPAWVYSGKLLALHLHGIPTPGHVLKHYPVPNSTLTVIIGVLCAVLPWQWAAKTYLLLHLLTGFGSIRALQRASQNTALIWFAVPAAVCFSLMFWYGGTAFQLGVFLTFFIVAELLRDRSREAMLSMLFLLLFFSHMVPFCFACLALMLYARQHKAWKLLAHLVLPSLLLIAYIVGRLLTGNQDSAAAPTDLHGMVSLANLAFKANSFLKSFGWLNLTDLVSSGSYSAAFFGKPIFLFLFAVNLLACGAAFFLFVRLLCRRPYPLPQAFVLQAMTLCIPVFLVMPRSLLGISDPGARVLQVAAWTALFLCPSITRAEQTAWRLQSVGSVTALAVSAVLFAVFPWSVPTRTPAPASTLNHFGAVPYAYFERFYTALNQQHYDVGAYPTGIFIETK